MAGRIILDMPNPALDAVGAPINGSMLTFYQNGTTILQGVFADIDLATPLSNPVTSDSAGRFPIIWADDLTIYSVVWSDAAGNVISTFDDITPLAPSAIGQLEVFLSQQISLPVADALAVSLGANLVINEDCALIADTTLNSNLRFAGGIITRGPYNLTITGDVTAGSSGIFDKLGSGSVRFTRNITSSLRWFSPTADGAADDTVPCRAWVASSADRYIDAGTYLTDTMTIPAIAMPISVSNRISGRVIGAGMWFVNFISLNGGDLFIPAAATFDAIYNFELGGFSCTGQGIATGAGYTIHLPVAEYGVTDINIHDVYSQSMGGGCNGINSGKVWGIFGDSTTIIALDATLTGAFSLSANAANIGSSVCLSNCNVEAFTCAGIILKNGTVSANDGCTFVSGAGANAAIYFAGGINYGGALDGTQFIRGAGGSWANNCPIWVSSVAPVLARISGNFVNGSFPIWDFFDGYQLNVATEAQTYLGNVDGVVGHVMAQSYNALYAETFQGGTRMGFWKANPVVQPTRVGQLTDSTGGAVSTTLAAITAGGSYSQTDMQRVKNALASIVAILNAMETNNHTTGLTA
jgi:hypothetical protein